MMTTHRLLVEADLSIGMTLILPMIFRAADSITLRYRLIIMMDTQRVTSMAMDTPLVITY